MSPRRIPVKLVAVGLVSLALLAWLPTSEATRRLLLLGWVLGFYMALAQWANAEEVRAFRRTLRAQPAIQPIPAEFFDADRLALQQDSHTWDQDVSTTSPQEAV
jgi:hypothetical protein